MDWSTGTHDHKVTRLEPPKPTLLEPAWRATSPTGKVLTCGIYRDVAGRVEVRAEYPDNNLIRSEVVRDIVTARELAAAWKDAALARGFKNISTY